MAEGSPVFCAAVDLPQDSAEFMGRQSMTWDGMSASERAGVIAYWQSAGCNPYLAFVLARKSAVLNYCLVKEIN